MARCCSEVQYHTLSRVSNDDEGKTLYDWPPRTKQSGQSNDGSVDQHVDGLEAPHREQGRQGRVKPVRDSVPGSSRAVRAVASCSASQARRRPF